MSDAPQTEIPRTRKIASALTDRFTESKLDKLFYTILVLLCNNPTFKGEIEKQLLADNMIHNDFSRDLLQEVLNRYDSMESPDEAKIAAMLDDEQRAAFIKEAAEYHTISDPWKALNDYISKYRHDMIVNNNMVLSRALASDGLSESEKENIKEELRKNTALLAKYKINT